MYFTYIFFKVPGRVINIIQNLINMVSILAICDTMYVIDIGSFRDSFVPRTSLVFSQCFCTADTQNVHLSEPFTAFRLNISVAFLETSSLSSPSEVFTQLPAIMYSILILSLTFRYYCSCLSVHLFIFPASLTLTCCRLHKSRDIISLVHG